MGARSGETCSDRTDAQQGLQASSSVDGALNAKVGIATGPGENDADAGNPPRYLDDRTATLRCPALARVDRRPAAPAGSRRRHRGGLLCGLVPAGQASGPREISAGDGQGIRFSLTWRARAADVTTEKWGTGCPHRPGVPASRPWSPPTGGARPGCPARRARTKEPLLLHRTTPPGRRLHRTCPPAQRNHDARAHAEGRDRVPRS